MHRSGHWHALDLFLHPQFKDKAIPFFSGVNWIRRNKPAVFVLENVAGLLREVSAVIELHGRVFKVMSFLSIII